MRSLTTLVLAAAIFAFSAPVFAQQPEREVTNGEDGDTIYEKVTDIGDFPEDAIFGKKDEPIITVIHGQTMGRTSSLITVRGNFIEEMIQSVENL